MRSDKGVSAIGNVIALNVRVEIMSSKPKIIINLNLKIGNQIII
jgi:tRNA U38,U39,U40 pseudouridine synthase TruA